MNLLITKTGRTILFTALYASEGAPIGFIWWALPTKLRSQGMPVEEITTLTALLVLPWALKFIWSPLIDCFRTERWSLKSWIITLQILMGVTLLPLAIIPFEQSTSILIPLLLAHAFFASSQDAAIDALAISEIPDNERGTINGWMQAGMLLGRSLFGGGVLLLASSLGDRAMIVALVSTIWLTSVLLFFSRESSSIRRNTPTLSIFVSHLKVVARTSSTWWGLAFAGIAGAAYEGVGSVAGPFLLDRGGTTQQIGFFFAVPSVVGMGVGAITGGYLADRLGTRRAVKIFLTLTCFAVFIVASIGSGTPSPVAILLTFTLLYITIGLFTASSYALFMEITNPQLGATHFSAFMGMTNVCESWSAFSVGRLVTSIGYSFAFMTAGAISLCTLPIVNKLYTALSDPAHQYEK